MVSLLIETVIAMALNIFLAKQAQVFVGSAMPPIACIILIAMQPRLNTLDIIERKIEGNEERYMLLTMGAVVLSLLLIRSMTTVGLWGGQRQDFSTQPVAELLTTICSCAVLVALGWFFLIRRSAVPLFARYQAPLLVVIVGCFAYFAINLARPMDEIPIEYTLIEAVELFGHLLNWTVGTAAIKMLRFSPYKIQGLSAALYNALAIVWIAFLEDSASVVSAIIMIVGFCVIFFVTLAPLRLQRSKGITKEAEIAILEMARDFRLTRREQEILLLLKQGRSRPYIQKTMHLSEGTVKTHTSHIYTKLAIHSRQQLLDVLEEYELKRD
jgi:DNA-binding CsgD family transcriptional regulator